ncbi:MAG: Lrp/AsnC family transcriptional regulator [Methanomassiliicoccus sp.]|nr:Lrp/AsnC family transcriptional regulator [Methanomassiliicoccus sp.]
MLQDDLDSRILRLLQRNGKLTYEEIGAMVDRSPSTIRDRIKKLEENKTIMGYSAIVNHERMGIGSDAYVSADIAPDKAQEAMASLFSLENVSEILRVTGERRIMFRVRASDNVELVDIIDRKIRPLGFHNLEVTMVLEPIVRYPGL